MLVLGHDLASQVDSITADFGTLYNSLCGYGSRIENQGTLINFGNFDSSRGGFTTNDKGTIVNYGKIVNYSTDFGWGGSLTNIHGLIYNYGNITLTSGPCPGGGGGTLINSHGRILNAGVITNEAHLDPDGFDGGLTNTNDGRIVNTGLLRNFGEMVNTSGNITNTHILLNMGKIISNSVVLNTAKGTVTLACGSTLSGNPIDNSGTIKTC